jgi:hypothetical protein
MIEINFLFDFFLILKHFGILYNHNHKSTGMDRQL